MPDLDLLKYTRARDDRNFIWRIAGAMVVKAQEIEEWDLSPESRQLVTNVIDNPMEVVPAMVNHVSTNPTIAANVSVNDGAVDTSAVPDSDILFVVGDKWDRVARSVYQAPPGPAAA